MVAANNAERRPGGRVSQALLWRQNHGRGVRGREKRDIARVVDEGDVAWLGVLDAGHATNVDVAVPFEAALQLFGQVPKLHQRACWPLWTFCTGRGSAFFSSGFPACSHALTIIEAVAVIAAASRSSSIGLTFWKNASKYTSS